MADTSYGQTGTRTHMLARPSAKKCMCFPRRPAGGAPAVRPPRPPAALPLLGRPVARRCHYLGNLLSCHRRPRGRKSPPPCAGWARSGRWSALLGGGHHPARRNNTPLHAEERPLPLYRTRRTRRRPPRGHFSRYCSRTAAHPQTVTAMRAPGLLLTGAAPHHPAPEV
jgi:hypothetical protein